MLNMYYSLVGVYTKVIQYNMASCINYLPLHKYHISSLQDSNAALSLSLSLLIFYKKKCLYAENMCIVSIN